MVGRFEKKEEKYMDSKTISVIVPVYNTELYLEECLESLIRQSLTDIEIILVNDGSTDKSATICQLYAKKDKRIKYIEIENAGVSNARNIGIKNATSEWITFVDSDDWVSQDYCKILASYINDKVGVIIGRTVSVENNIVFDDFFKGKDKQYFTTNEEKNILYTSIINDSPKIRKYPHLATCSAKLFRKRILDNNNIKYCDDLKYYEDALFNMEVISSSQSVTIVSDIVYYYRMHNSSSTRLYSKDIIDYYQKAYKKLIVFASNINLQIQNDFYCFNIKNLNTILVNYFRTIDNFKEQCIFVKMVCHQKIFYDAIKNVSIKTIWYRRRILLVILARFKCYKMIAYLYNWRK